MSVKIWNIECDLCGKDIDVTKEGFIQSEDLDICNECFNDVNLKRKNV